MLFELFIGEPRAFEDVTEKIKREFLIKIKFSACVFGIFMSVCSYPIKQYRCTDDLCYSHHLFA